MENTATTTKKWNRLALLSMGLWLGIVFLSQQASIIVLLHPVALVGGIMSFKQIKKTGEKGKWLAIGVIALAGLNTLALVLSLLLVRQ